MPHNLLAFLTARSRQNSVQGEDPFTPCRRKSMNNHHSSDPLKSFANQLARAAGAEDAVRALLLLRSAGLLIEPTGPDNSPVEAEDAELQLDAAEEGDRVGIWERKKGSNNFVRRRDLANQWTWWANVGRIGPKQAKRRVVLIGESVARGYLFDPQFNPAKALDSIFRSRLGAGEIEVVDLAKTGMSCELAKDVALSSLVLEPDCVIIFAGNNWVSDSYRAVGSANAVAALAEGGIPAVKRLVEEKLAELGKAIVGEIADQFVTKHVPLVWVLPEFNLGDWRDPVTSAPYLADGKNWEWIENSRMAVEAMERGDFEKAAELGDKMVELDGGTCVRGFQILAECARENGDMERAKAYLESARDALMWSPISRFKTPRPYALTHRVLRAEMAKEGIQIVDLPKLFAEYLDGSLPDRRLFVDYCHLTVEGIQIAMSAAASCVLRAFEGSDLPWRSLRNHCAAPSHRVQAEAMFLAAVYNAHLNQSRDLVAYFCLQSLRCWPEIGKIMTAFAEVQTRRSPMLMCKSAEVIADPQFPSVQKYLLHFNLHLQQLDKMLLDAMVASLRETGNDARTQLERLRVDEHSVRHASVDLLDRYYCLSAPQEFAQPLAGDTAGDAGRLESESDYYKAYSPESSFIFIGEADCAVSLCLACRLPQLGAVEGRIAIELNSEPQGDVAISQRWQSYDIALDASAIKTGLNEVRIRWPIGEIAGKRGIECGVEDLLANIVPDVYPVFGEIHSFMATVAKQDTLPSCAPVDTTMSLTS
jgi:hypothetical protein